MLEILFQVGDPCNLIGVSITAHNLTLHTLA